MPSGVYERTELHREICRQGGLVSPTTFKKGHLVPKEWIEKAVEVNKGRIPWNKNTKGLMPMPWNKGKHPEYVQKENHPMWGEHHTKATKRQISLSKGGTGERKRYNHCTSLRVYKEWRMNVFLRDDFTCQDCGKVGGYMTAHHIKSWAKYPELRYKLSNGLTLCEECHSKTDNYRGRGRT